MQFLKTLHSSCKFLLVVICLITITACATPATKIADISESELRQEQQMQVEMAKKYPAKAIKRKHQDLAIYQQRLNKAAAPLVVAAKKVTKEDKRTYEFKIVEKGGLNAWTDGKNVVFTPEMMDFLETDKELATVIAHELSHNVMHHHSKQQQNFILGTLIDIVAATKGFDTNGVFGSIGSVSFSQGFENEADYVGIYIMAVAGHDISNVHHLWRKMTVQTKSGTQGSFFSSHPSNPERFIRMRRTIEEIQNKIKTGQKLEPNYKA